MYREWTTSVPGAVLWHTAAEGGPAGRRSTRRRRILPDGCMDLIWAGDRLFVAGPDTAARMHDVRADVDYVGLRMSAGVGPALLGLPAQALTDECPDLDAVWGDRPARALQTVVAEDALNALPRWAAQRARSAALDPLGPAILILATDGVPAADTADRLGLTTRTLHRAALRLFGYGPRHLTRIQRFTRALDAARSGLPLAAVAAEHGYADQAHLSREARDLGGATMTALLKE